MWKCENVPISKLAFLLIRQSTNFNVKIKIFSKLKRKLKIYFYICVKITLH